MWSRIFGIWSKGVVGMKRFLAKGFSKIAFWSSVSLGLSAVVLGLGLVLLGLGAAGCGKNTAQAGDRSCETLFDCPPGWTCDQGQGKCVPITDAAVPDADLGDGGPDGGPDDGGPDGEARDGAPDDGQIVDVYVPDAEPPDAGPATCIYVPTPGEFSPHMECRWDTPHQYVNYDDVVMAPVVANITDDNMDGVIDTDDIPDVLFASYDYEGQGCCGQRGVLRVVSGRCAADATHLTEHFHLADPFLDNSGGIAVGDIDGDAHPDIVTTRWTSNQLPGCNHTQGTVAYSAVFYDRFMPISDSADLNEWTPQPGGAAFEAVDEDPHDALQTFIRGQGAAARQAFGWDYDLSTAAVATVRVTAVAQAVNGNADLKLFVKSGAQVHSGEPITINSANFTAYTTEFAKNPFDNDNQWQDADLAALEFGVERSDDATSLLQVTQAYVTVGYVIKKWESEHPQGSSSVSPYDQLTAAQPAIVDLDRDGIAEVLMGRVVLDGLTGQPKWRGLAGRGINSFMGPISIAADLDLDGIMEVVAGNTCYRADGVELWTYDFSYGANCGGYDCDGFNATGNFDADPEGEVVIVRDGIIYVLEHDGTLKVEIPLPWDNCSRNEGGAPTVADFDGDGNAEIGVAGADYYSVIDLDCCASMPTCDATPANNPDCQAPGIRWYVPNEDCSSRTTGSSVFDFDGDGSAEVVYNDECQFRIFSGMDGAELFAKNNHSHTRLEYTVIADTDNDGNAEIVFIENGWCANRCAPCDETTGIQIWGDAQDLWVPTRRIWNQHAYHITNVTEDGLLPLGGEQPNWLIFNNYRQNMPDYDVFAAPDLTVQIIGYERQDCPAELIVVVEVCNEGDLRVGPGVPVDLYDQATQDPIPCTTLLETSDTLNPGACEELRCWWPAAPIEPDTAELKACVDNGSWACDEAGTNNECHEDNNTDQYADVGCSEEIVN
jgi:hypothetical protein